MLSNRRKYKCSKCSGLFLQTIIDNEDFRYWNERQRKLDVENLKPRKLTKEEKKLRIKEWRERNKEKLKIKAAEWRENNRDHYNKQKREYWAKNKTRINAKDKKEYWEKRGEKLGYLKEWRDNNKELARQKHRLAYWRAKQRDITLQFFENFKEVASTERIRRTLPTFLLSDLLSF